MNCIVNLSRLTTTGGIYNTTNPAFLVSVRNASKKTGKTTKNSKQSRGRHRGIKVQDGFHVYANDIIATQYKLNWHPGLNVTMRPGSKTLHALKDGIVRFTCEKMDLKEDLGFFKRFYPEVDPEVPLFKKYANVIPTPQHQRFKLIKQV